MKVNETRCDRCNASLPVNTGSEIVVTKYSGSRSKLRRIAYDLCKDCAKSLDSFMDNNDYVGTKRYIFIEGPCPHHVPCAGPCGSEIKIPTGRL